MAFDIKSEDFRCKTRLVAEGHIIQAQNTITYVSILTRDTVRISLMIAALDNLEVELYDILIAYLQAPSK